MNMRMRKLFESFGAAKNLTAETSPASLSCGLCMCRQGGIFEEYYIKADKALYYVKQNGKNSYRFYEELEEQQTDAQARKNDLEVIAGALLESGIYTGALNLDYREFARLYQYVSSLGERYRHRCYLVLATMGAKLDQTMYIDHIDKAMECMDKAIPAEYPEERYMHPIQLSPAPAHTGVSRRIVYPGYFTADIHELL